MRARSVSWGATLTLVVAGALAAGPSARAQVASPPAAASAAPPGRITYLLEQIVTGPLPPEMKPKMVPLHRLGDVEELLKREQIQFAWHRTEINSDQINPQLAQQIAALPPGEVFVVPAERGVTINVIVGRR